MSNLTAEEKLNKIKDILREAEGVADSQDFGLNYCQTIAYLDEIKEVLKGG